MPRAKPPPSARPMRGGVQTGSGGLGAAASSDRPGRRIDDSQRHAAPPLFIFPVPSPAYVAVWNNIDLDEHSYCQATFTGPDLCVVLPSAGAVPVRNGGN